MQGEIPDAPSSPPLQPLILAPFKEPEEDLTGYLAVAKADDLATYEETSTPFLPSFGWIAAPNVDANPRPSDFVEVCDDPVTPPPPGPTTTPAPDIAPGLPAPTGGQAPPSSPPHRYDKPAVPKAGDKRKGRSNSNQAKWDRMSHQLSVYLLMVHRPFGFQPTDGSRKCLCHEHLVSLRT